MKPRIRLSSPQRSDQRDFLAAAGASLALHRPWVTAPSTPQAFRAYVAAMQRPENRGFVVRSRADDGLVGVISVTNIVRGIFRSAYLGYYAFAGYERQGLMTEALRAVVREAFGPMKLHRLEANIQPGNVASIALVKACGFSLEGYSPRYLKIGGRWRDHERWAIVAR
ncbi:GNAT family N-acetyltransferase [Caldimonas sp. KR1-144]|uniref:GNAT family N-acetyltransferase n=1 Tax=Caldimonas sp. KR1-144 TaxID=3400911 RepID=UPI003BFCDE53